MLLNVLNQYLQNQLTQPAVTGVNVTASSTEKSVQPGADPYEPSARAIMISAVASEFDVTDLSGEDLNRLQDRLQQYGLLNQSDVKILSRLHVRDNETERMSAEPVDSHINAFDDINRLRSEQASSMPYQSRQALYRVQTLIHNLESATRSLTGETVGRQLN